MFTIITTLNPLTGGETSQEHEWVKGKPLSHYVKHDGKCVVEWNQILIDLPLSEIYPARREVYRLTFIPEGVDRQEWRLIGFSAMAGVSMIPGWGPYAAYVGANLISTFLQDKKPNIDQSQSYAWRHMASPAAAFGTAMPLVYGKTHVRPTLKNRFITVDGDKQTLYALYGVTGHLVDQRTLPDYALGFRGPEVEWAVEPGRSFINSLYYAELRRASVPRYALYNNENQLGTGWSMGHGTASFASDIFINGRAIEDYNKDVEWETRPGLAQQSVIQGFDITYTNSPQSESLYLDTALVNRKEARFSYSTAQRIIAWGRHSIFSQGSNFTVKQNALTLGVSVIRHIIYRPSLSTSTYFSVATPLVGDTVMLIINTGTGVVTYPTLEVAADDWFSPTATFSEAHNLEIIFELPSGLYSRRASGALITNKCSLFAQYRAVGTSKWIDFAYEFSESLHIESYIDETLNAGILSRKTTKPIAVSMKALPPDGALLDPKLTYEIRVTAASSSPVNLINAASLIYGAENAEEAWPGFTYPGEALIGIKALASGQLNSDLDVQVDVERSKVWVWNTRLAASNKWVEADADNHAWAVYDILVQGFYNTASARIHPAYPDLNIVGNTWTNADGTFEAQAQAIYGCGIDPERIDYESFRTWAENINTIGYTLNIVFDTFMTAWDAILRICQEGRGMVYPIGATIYAFTDKAEDVSQIFTMGTIQTDSFVQKYVESKQQINLVEVDYFDANKNYEKTGITARKSDWDSSRDVSVPSKVTLYGTDNFDQAQSIARFMLMGTELLDNVMVFEVDIDSLAALAGEVIGVQHSITDAGIGCGGRIVRGRIDTPFDEIIIDQSFEFEGGVTYTLEVKHGDGTLETHNFQFAVTGEHDEINFTEATWTDLPAKYEPFTIYKVSIGIKKYRITKISRSTELMRTLQVIQYDEQIYGSWVPGDDAIAAPLGEFTAAKVPVGGDTIETLTSILNPASNLQLQEIISRNNVTGEYESSIIATWDTENGEPRGNWEVWFRDVDASDIDWQGAWLVGSTYSYGDKVEHSGYTFISLIDDNAGITPVLSGRTP